MRIEFIVPAVPVAQPRPRAVRRGNRAGVHEVTTIKQADGSRKAHPIVAFKATVRHAAALAYQGAPLTGALSAELVFVMPRPANLTWKTKPMPRLPHTNKPDVDNIIKAVFDSLNELTFASDAQVCRVTAEKWIASGNEQPHVAVSIREIEQ